MKGHAIGIGRFLFWSKYSMGKINKFRIMGSIKLRITIDMVFEKEGFEQVDPNSITFAIHV